MARETIIEKILAESRYNPKKQPKAEQIVLTLQSHNIGSRQNFITLTGPPKAGKSRFLSAMVASGLTGNEIFTLRLRLDDEHFQIVHIDTEQGEYDYYKMIDQIKKMANIDHMPDYFHSYSMREHDPKTLIHAIEHLLKSLRNIGVIILDGILDLLYSYNDEAESKALINLLKKWSKKGDCLIVCILHIGKTTGSTVGHFGAMSDRAAQTILEIKRNDEGQLSTYTLVTKQSRSADPAILNTVEIYWNIQEKRWVETGSMPLLKKKDITPEDLHMDQHKATLRRIFDARGLELKYADLVTEIYQAYNQPRRWAKQCVTFMLNTNLVSKTEAGLYTIIKQAKMKL